jgi:ABC-type branched-subunit amino acid transport system ATPase component
MSALLQLKDVSKSFGGVLALSRVSFEVCEAEIVGLIGPNGSGKTTVFNIISRLFELDEGAVTLRGTDLLKLRPHQVARLGVARLFQGARLCENLTAYENIAMAAYGRGRRLRPEDATGHAERLGFGGLAGKLNRHPDVLSQFERRQAEMVQAVVAQPELLLLDEPTAGFAQHERDLLAEAIKAVNARGTAVIIIEHDLSLIHRVAGRVVVLDAGRKVVEGIPEEVAADETVAKIYLGKIDAAA